MIKLSIDQKSINALNNEINLKVEAIGQMTKSSFLDEVAKAAFTIITERFVLAADRYAVRNPKAMHHVYEWKSLGNPNARLFVLDRTSIVNGNLVITSRFTQSRVPVPIDPELLIPGKTGKYVNSRNVFRNKAQVMEDGQQITYEAQRMLAFKSIGGLHFIRPGTIVNIKNPGGVATKNAFSTFMLDWYNSNAQSIMDASGLYEKIVNDTSLLLSRNGTGMEDVQKLVTEIANTVSAGKVQIK
jgi:hypothetical protein